MEVVALLHELRELAQIDHLVAINHGGKVVVDAVIAEREHVVEQHPAHGGDQQLSALWRRLRGAMRIDAAARRAHPHLVVQLHGAVLVREYRLL